MKPRLRRRKESVRHVDDWLMTYADMITLLLCFFALLLALTLAPGNAEKKDEPPHLQSEEQKPEEKKEEPPPAEQKAEESAPSEHPVAPETPAPRAETPPPPETEPEAVPAPDPLPALIERLKAQGGARIEQKGDRLTTVEMDSATFFAPGAASLSDAGRDVLHGVAATLQNETYKDYQITVEGHTDDTPIKTPQFPSNWELSTARAAAVVQYFLTQGIPAQRLRAAGYADTFPKVPNRDEMGRPLPEGQAQNRRVVIRLEKVERGSLP